PELVEVLRKIGKSGGIVTLGGICRLTVDGFNAACGDGNGILFGKFMTWAESKIPDDGNIMVGVFRYRGFDVELPYNSRSIIRVLIKG
ncbi:MAG: hypothetical protein QG568_555, partial [Patescibacteria group bacterium]|nr:hypothetical protein [Patescibacteria group bacterium]